MNCRNNYSVDLTLRHLSRWYRFHIFSVYFVDIVLTLIFCKNTIDDVRIIGATSVEDIFTWIDAAYAVHNDMISHTGGCMSLGIGTLHSKIAVQKLNTNSSTESEIVGVSKYLPYNIWIINFIAVQCYKIKNNIA